MINSYKLESTLEFISATTKKDYGNCPFCGENNNSLNLNEYKNLYWVYCKNCHADGPSKIIPMEAIKAWQTLNIKVNKE